MPLDSWLLNSYILGRMGSARLADDKRVNVGGPDPQHVLHPLRDGTLL